MGLQRLPGHSGHCLHRAERPFCSLLSAVNPRPAPDPLSLSTWAFASSQKKGVLQEHGLGPAVPLLPPLIVPGQFPPLGEPQAPRV